MERQSVSVECGVDSIEIIVNRTQLIGEYHELCKYSVYMNIV